MKGRALGVASGGIRASMAWFIFSRSRSLMKPKLNMYFSAVPVESQGGEMALIVSCCWAMAQVPNTVILGGGLKTATFVGLGKLMFPLTPLRVRSGMLET